MTHKQTVLNYLESEPKFRERSNKNRGIVNLLMRRHGILKGLVGDGTLKKETIVSICEDYATMDRAWRQALEHDETLRGKDYGQKEKLETETQRSLGYNV